MAAPTNLVLAGGDLETEPIYRPDMRGILVVALLVSSAASAERLYAPGGGTRDVPDASVEAAIKDGYRRIPTVHMRAKEGGVYMVSEDKIAAAERDGFWKMTDAEISAYNAELNSKASDRAVKEFKAAESARTRNGVLLIAGGIAFILAIVYAAGRWLKRGAKQ